MSHNHKTKQQYYDDGATWEQEIVSSALQSKKRAWIVTIFSLSLAVISGFSFLMIFPLKTFEPYVITVDRNTGYTEVTKGLKDGDLTQEDAITESNLVRYVSAREQYNLANIKENYGFVELLSTGDALKEYKSLWSGNNPENPSIRLGHKNKIDIKIKSVSFLNDRTASIRFLREQYNNEQVKTSHWNAIIEFQYSGKPMKMSDRFSNPLGFQVSTYRINPEVLEKIK